MAYYNLLIVDQQKTLDTPARDRDEALSIFGKKLSLRLSLEDDAQDASVYLLDESEDSRNWLNHYIRVYASVI
jgi:hypothetical protein